MIMSSGLETGSRSLNVYFSLKSVSYCFVLPVKDPYLTNSRHLSSGSFNDGASWKYNQGRQD